MLILAGVSLNALVGDNGIISNAQQANMKSGMAALEEWLQEEYVKYYDEEDNYTSKPEFLNAKRRNLLLKDGSRNYILNNGKVYYLINKNNLPKEIKEGLVGGDTTEYEKYTRLIDVYGITEDLKVYYCDYTNEENPVIYGKVDVGDVDLNQSASLINNDTNAKQFITDVLSNMGLAVDSENGITLGNVLAINNLTIDGTKTSITSLSSLSDVKNLKSLTLTNISLADLEGLEGCPFLNYLYIKNCLIEDYTNLESCLNLQYLYVYMDASKNEEKSNDQINRLGLGLKNASGLTKLEYMGIVGDTKLYTNRHEIYCTSDAYTQKPTYTASYRNNLTSIAGLSQINSTIKSNLKYLYLINNNLMSISALEGFSGLVEVDVACNRNLSTLSGLENHTKLYYCLAQNCNLTSVEGLTGCNNLRVFTCQNNPNLSNLKGIEDSIYLDWIIASSCNLTDITALAKLTVLRNLTMSYNYNLINVSTLGNCIKITQLYLKDNTNMDGEQLGAALGNKDTHILKNCGTKFELPAKYLLYFDTVDSYNYLYDSANDKTVLYSDTSDEIKALKGKTGIRRLNLWGQSNLTDGKLQEVLSTMTGLEVLNLNGCSQLRSLNFLKGVANEKTGEFDNPVSKLKEIDLRNTPLLTDLTLLNTYGTNLFNVCVNNTGIGGANGLKSIETAITRVQNNCLIGGWNRSFSDSWIGSESYNCRGFQTSGNFDWSVISTLPSNFIMGRQATGTMDLSGNLGINWIYINSALSLKVPSSCTAISQEVGNFYYVDLSVANSLQSISVNGAGNLSNIFSTLPTVNSLSYISFKRSYLSDLNWLSSGNLSNLTTFHMTGYVHQRSSLGSLNGISGATNLKTLRLTNCNISSISYISGATNLETFWCENASFSGLSGIESCSKLTSLIIINHLGTISDLTPISNLTSIKHLVLQNCGFAPITALNKFKNLEDDNELSFVGSVCLTNNNIADLTPLLGTITYKDENDKVGKIQYTVLDLRNNSLDDCSGKNISTLNALHSAGLEKVYISDNAFTTNEISSIINIFGSDNVVR